MNFYSPGKSVPMSSRLETGALMPCIFSARSWLAVTAHHIEKIARSVANVVEIGTGKIVLVKY